MENTVFKYSEFFNDDGGLETVKQKFYKLSDELIKKAKEVREKTKIVGLENLESLQSIEKETEELIAVNKKYQTSLKQIDSLEKKLAKSRKKELPTITKGTEALKKHRSELRQVAKMKNTQAGTVENLRAKLSLVTTAWTKLTAKEIENTKRGQRLNESKKQLTATLKRLEKATNDNRRNVGNYSGALGKLRGSLVSVFSAMGVGIGLFGAFRLLKNTTSIVRDYEKANATLAGVLNKTTNETKELHQQSQFLGATTVRTAQDVVKLQTAYARLGFTQSEILKLTAPTIDGSIALNASLEETSLLVGAVVNSYDNLSATDAPKILETLTAGTTKSALTFEKLRIGLPYVIGASNALNISLEETTATLGALADAGIETSTAATAYRNILIESAKLGIDYKEALDKITKSQDKLSTANKIFGKRAAISALIISNNAKGVAELTEELDKAKVVQKLVSNELNTLDGSIKLIISAWEGFVIQLNDSTNSGNALSTSIRYLAENLVTIFKVIGIATTTWIAYTLAVKLSNTVTKANIVWTKADTIAKNINTIATNVAKKAQLEFNTAVKANPLGFAIALLATAVTAYYAFRDSVSDAEKAQKKFNDAKKEGEEIGDEIHAKESKELDNVIKKINQEYLVRKAKGEDSKKLDIEFSKRKSKIYLDEADRIQKSIDKGKDEIWFLKKFSEGKIRTLRKLENSTATVREGGGKTDAEFRKGIEERVQKEIENFKTASGKIIGLNKSRITAMSKLNKKYLAVYDDLNVKESEIDSKRLKELALLKRRLEDLNDQAIKDAEKREKKQTKRKYNREINVIKSIEKKTQVHHDLIAKLEERRGVEVDLITKKYILKRKKGLEDFEKFELSLAEEGTKKLISKEKAKSKLILTAIKESKRLEEDEKTKYIIAENKRSALAISEIEINSELDKINKRKLIAEAQILQQKSDFKTVEEFEKFKQDRLKEIELKALKERLDVISKFKGDKFKVEIEQIKAQIEGLSTELDVDPFVKFANEIKNVFSAVFSEIDKVQRESINSAKKLLDEQSDAIADQRKRADEGLSNSLAFEQRELGKREAELIKRQKRQERLQKIKALYSAYNNYSGQGEKYQGEAITKALRDFAILEAITASFGDGGVVEDKLPSNGVFRGQSHQGNKGGIPILVEGREGILSTREMDNLGKENFYKMKDMASMGKVDSNFFSKQREGFIQAVPVNRTDQRVINELQGVKKAIESQPVSSWDIPGFTNGMMDIVETIKTKRQTKRNHYVVRKPRI